MMKRVLSALVAIAATAGCSPEMPTTDACKGRAAGDLIITELMIDPDGTDTGGEWIEIFNTLGTPLELKGLTLYVRDTDGSGSKTHAIRAGTAPARGYFVMGDIRSGPNPAWINYSYADGLGSMGNARGVVGIRCGQTTLAEFTYNSTAKPARSRMLDGVSEPNTAIAAVEQNYCDAPVGSTYFGNNSGTPGAANPVCQAEATMGTCVDNGTVRPMTPPQPGDLVITEVMASPSASGDTTGEWIEVLARASVDLNDVSINTTTSSTRITNMNCLRVAPDEYVLLARSGDSFVNGGLPTPKHVYGSISFADTTNQRISLTRGDAGIDEIALLPSSAGKAWQLDPLKLDPGSNDDPAAFCKAPNRWNLDGGGDYGSPGAANPECPLVDAGVPVDPNNCVDPSTQLSRPIRRPNDGELVLTEWMPDPNAASDTNGEYVEVMAKADVDLNGLGLQIGTSKTVFNSNLCLVATTNSFVVFGKNTAPAQNGNLPTLAGVFTGGLVNSGGTITLLNADGGTYDSITYGTSTAGASFQVKPGSETPTDNDVPGNVCVTPTNVRYGVVDPNDGGVTGDRGTPGRANAPCP